MEETVEERTVLKEENAEIFINGKDAMAVLDTDEFERHTGGVFHSIFGFARRAKTAVASKRNEFEVPTMGTTVHSATKRRITAV